MFSVYSALEHQASLFQREAHGFGPRVTQKRRAMVVNSRYPKTILIVNKRNGACDGEYIGRPSPLGNPFPIGDCGSREVVIEQYRKWLSIALAKPGRYPEANVEFYRLCEKHRRDGRLTLVCWCSPLPCHGDVIADFIEDRVDV